MNMLNKTIQARITSLNQLRFVNEGKFIDGSKQKHCNKALKNGWKVSLWITLQQS